ncbi:3-isopropylmalate dehydratase small subunit [Sphingomonas bacterium]|uniref:3-isopropylmalate dehydratase small subunit n=1 Tax=Sphingomonas bacterium TaxID=1895847 RepID=UPI001577049C|nr:3-isopropylmalate dehydratase small subunit [Sphingomonas bacterium]
MPEPFTLLTGSAVPLLRDNIDTDTISPGSPPKRNGGGTAFGEHGSTTLADDLFANWRYTPEGDPVPGFVLNQPRYQGSRILLAGANFGCGSSRESAVWMLAAWGIRCVVAPSFAEIFSANCFANGLLPLALSADVIVELAAEADTHGAFTVDLECSVVSTPAGRAIPFQLSAYRRRGLLTGLDDIALTLSNPEQIEDYLVEGRSRSPWLYPAPGALAVRNVPPGQAGAAVTRTLGGA